MELTAYLHPGWAPLIRPAPATRAWMDATPESFAYRCLPLNIANAHGWEILCPCGFEAVWNGDVGHRGGDDPARSRGGPAARSGLAVRPGRADLPCRGHLPHAARLEPMDRRIAEPREGRHRAADRDDRDRLVALHLHHELALHPRRPRRSASRRWSRSASSSRSSARRSKRSSRRSRRWTPIPRPSRPLPRLERGARRVPRRVCCAEPPKSPADRWQKHYYRGVDVAGETLVRRSPRQAEAASRSTAQPLRTCRRRRPMKPRTRRRGRRYPPRPLAQADEIGALRRALAKRDWLLETVERQRALAPDAAHIERRLGVGAEEFLERYYAPGRPVILGGEMDDWPALARWTPDYLKAKVGAAVDRVPGRPRTPTPASKWTRSTIAGRRPSTPSSTRSRGGRGQRRLPHRLQQRTEPRRDRTLERGPGLAGQVPHA